MATIALAFVIALASWFLGRAAGRFMRSVGEGPPTTPATPPAQHLPPPPLELLTAFVPRDPGAPVPAMRELPPAADAPCWVCGRPLADGNHDHPM